MSKRNKKREYGLKDLFKLQKEILSDATTLSEYDNFYNPATMRSYGKVDLSGNLVYLSETFLDLLPNPNKASANTMYALGFVAQAFADLRKYYIQAVTAGVVKQDNTNLLEPLRAWQSVHKIYSKHVNTIYSNLINGYLQAPKTLDSAGDSSDRYPSNFEQFMAATTRLFSTTGNGIPLTRSSFIASDNCTILTTGLAIEVGPSVGYSDIHEIQRSFYENENFDFYMKALKKFGFMADINYPGRIIADIGSPVMQEYMSFFGVTVKNLFETMYYKTSDYDYDLIKIYLTQFYTDYVADYPSRRVTKKSGTVIYNNYVLESNNFATNNTKIPSPTSILVCTKDSTHVVEKEVLTEDMLSEKYNDSYWLPIYAQMLNYELDFAFDNDKMGEISKNAVDINKFIDIDSAKGYINDMFKNFRYPVQNVYTSQEKVLVDVLEQSAFGVAPEPTLSTTTNGGSSGGSSGGGGGY